MPQRHIARVTLNRHGFMVVFDPTKSYEPSPTVAIMAREGLVAHNLGGRITETEAETIVDMLHGLRFKWLGGEAQETVREFAQLCEAHNIDASQLLTSLDFIAN